MSTALMAAPHVAAIDLNQPGTYLHWSIFDISVANLVVIAVMVAIFGAALLLPFPHRNRTLPAAAEAAPGSEPVPGAMGDDAQPAYVASWVYVFGVATLAALGVAIVSGFVIAIGGTDWWHTNPVGHFFNSTHLWSVELFMAFMVIHLWGKFWMAAWRGRRALTWITGVVAFAASVVECFTGYLTQQNFDSQWIATNGKDAFNAVGVGAFFNVLNFGQMLLWHVVLVPIILVALVGAHVLLVRVRGVSHPLPAKRIGWRNRAARKAAKEAAAAPWRGPTRRYDILKEGTIATAIALALVLIMAAVLSSPDVPSVSVQSWAKVAPADFLGTAAAELNGTAGAASYGPPYNTGTGAVQQVGPVNWQTLAGVTQPVNAAQDFVVTPLQKLAPFSPALAAALTTYTSAPAAQQQKWATAYGDAVTKVKFVNGTPVVPPASDGPVPVMMATELNMARSGALDADLLAQRQFYGTDYTRPLLFIADGEYYAQQAEAMHLTGDQWWLFQLWYHVAPFNNSPAVDVWAVYLTGIGTLLLLAVPFIPGLRDIPRLIPVHRLIWRSGRDGAGDGADPGAEGRPVGSAAAGHSA